MLNREIISESIPTLLPTDPVGRAQELMNDFHLAHLPVIQGDQWLGLVSEDSLLGAEGEAVPVSHLQAEFSTVAASAQNHFSEAVHLANEYQLTLVPVLDKSSQYLGAITTQDLLTNLGKITGIGTPGGIVVLEMEKSAFSFSEISKLVETNDAQITQLNTYLDGAASLLVVTLKINRQEISDVLATFQRYEYKVKYYFGEELYENELRSNYDHLMNYLSI